MRLKNSEYLTIPAAAGHGSKGGIVSAGAPAAEENINEIMSTLTAANMNGID
jgi:hypothetical protein